MISKSPPLGSRLLDVATALGWRVVFHGTMPDGTPIAALYNAASDYVGLVCVHPKALLTLITISNPFRDSIVRGTWDSEDLADLWPLQLVYAQC